MTTKEDSTAILGSISEFETKYKDVIRSKTAAGLTPEQARDVVREQVRYDAAQIKPNEEKPTKGK
ncbi:MAG TPA: hypothetical protein PKJ41_14610 [Bryobacteraceae bacterium]|nr:hypothetical protein [Bryobacteraceae bacterium]